MNVNPSIKDCLDHIEEKVTTLRQLLASTEKANDDLRYILSLAFVLLDQWDDICFNCCDDTTELKKRAKQLREDYVYGNMPNSTKEGEAKSSKPIEIVENETPQEELM